MHSQLLVYLNSFTGKYPLFDALVIVAARYFQFIVIAYALILMYRVLVAETPELSPFRQIKKAITEGFWVFLAVALAMSLTYILKFSFHIPRPFLSGVTPLFVHGGLDSFPSGHATFFAALAVSMFLYHKKRGWWFLISALIIGVARIIAGVHYPIDVFVGYLIGALSALFIVKAFRPWVKKNIFRI